MLRYCSAVLVKRALHEVYAVCTVCCRFLSDIFSIRITQTVYANRTQRRRREDGLHISWLSLSTLLPTRSQSKQALRAAVGRSSRGTNRGVLIRAPATATGAGQLPVPVGLGRRYGVCAGNFFPVCGTVRTVACIHGWF